MTKWLTEDPVGKWFMTALGAIVMAGLVDPLKATPGWAHLVGAASGLILGLVLRFGRKPLALLTTTAVGACAPWYAPLLRATWYGLSGFLRSPYELRGWVLVLIVVVSAAAPVAVIVLIAWLSSPPASSVNTAPWRTYQSDNIFGAFWRWDWDSSGITNLAGFCPRDYCQNQLVKIDYRTRAYPELICVNCGFGIRTPDDATNWYKVEQRVKLEIQRRVRTGEYRRTLETEQHTNA